MFSYISTKNRDTGFLFIVVFACAFRATPVPAGTLSGPAVVHDGDTIRIENQSIRLWGIDAVELKQRCAGNDCGIAARETLRAIIDGRRVTCTPKGKSYRRIVALCRGGDLDIAAEMVRRGMAFDYARYSNGFYAGDEHIAKATQTGLWASPFVEDPAHWRACNLPARKHQRPGDC